MMDQSSSSPLPEPYRLLFRKSATPLAIAHLNGPSPQYSSRFIDWYAFATQSQRPLVCV
jgi:hypothetical protein